MITKRDLDLTVSAETGVPPQKVALVTTTFLSAIRRGLVQDGEIRLPGLGRLRTFVFSTSNLAKLTAGTGKKGQRRGTRTVEVPRQLRVFFSKSTSLSKMLKEKHGGSDDRRRKGNVKIRRR